MKKCSLKTKSTHLPTIQTAFEQFQRQNTVKNLSHDTIEFYASKAKRFFCFLGDTEQRIDIITQETVEGYARYTRRELNKGQLAELLHVTRPTLERMIREYLSTRSSENP